ncbi:hypothetical protein A3D03_02715 [Candidatus Gottesmanbacteria bacterium RIFCSPHIGHO2_02_FULL_40_13]|uniref:DUF6879 domain-containing protein n=1 Tax=Candidatus Gottesmanbacteria bacterium RIFCSPHIGHO2_02_FULL_40_13 TaxID=1798384 RepID=A0A1F6A938_9BACT|nr:MAG: hypothetical protein A3D03_02715 [Candidatus Gottesmanbacteria bacterium RIFCSPHIGHO2_02_FULL_40_13]
MQFVIFHGAFGGPEENWFPQLGEKLSSLGQKVVIPRFPVDDWGVVTKNGPGTPPKNQTLDHWLKTFEKVFTGLNQNDKICFIGHSLGPLFTLHALEKYNIQLDSAVFVSPFLSLPDDKYWQVHLVNKTFYKTDFDFTRLKRLIPISYALYSDNDPYVDKKYSIDFAQKLGSSPIQVLSAGHMNSEVNLNEFPLVLELCKSRLDLSLYQKYLDHRRDLYSVDYAKGKSEEIIYLKPKDVFDEGIFHFRNLKKGGFCTLYTGATFWDTHSKYMQEARKAAKRTGNLTRVYVVENKTGMQRPLLIQQVRLDLEAGVKVYFCRLENIKNEVGEPDFGIWDEDYVCYVRFNKNKKAQDVVLSSRKKDIDEALKWQKIILHQAVRINNFEKDLKKFLN